MHRRIQDNTNFVLRMLRCTWVSLRCSVSEAAGLVIAGANKRLLNSVAEGAEALRNGFENRSGEE